MNKMPVRVVGIIPARKGSKGVVGKNMRKVGDKPLLQYTIEAALNSKELDELVISTDSKEIMEFAVSFGCTTNGIRPDILSTDTALSVDVVKYELGKIQEIGKTFSHAMLLQPTCPLRTEVDIDKCIELVRESKGSVVSVTSVGAYHPLRMKRIVEGKLVNYVDTGLEDMRPRQKLPEVYIRNGAIYLTPTGEIMDNNSMVCADVVPYVMEESRSVNIDREIDLAILSELLGV